MSVCFGTTSGNYKVGTRQRPTTSNNTNSRLLFVFSLMSMPAARLEEPVFESGILAMKADGVFLERV